VRASFPHDAKAANASPGDRFEIKMTESETYLPFDEGVRRIFRYTWRLTLPSQEDRQTRQTDLCGWDGDIPIGRIFLLPDGLHEGMWLWNGPGLGIQPRLQPPQGYERTASEAASKVEDYYNRLTTHNGMQNAILGGS
jgi:hypothetical protein